MIIRPAKVEDVVAIDLLYKGLDPNHKPSLDFIHEVIGLPHCYIIVVEEISQDSEIGDVVGTSNFVELPQASRQKDAFMHDWTVREDRRGRGYGRMMFAELEREARGRGCIRMMFTSGSWRGMAEIYVRWGYVMRAVANGDHGTNFFEKRL